MVTAFVYNDLQQVRAGMANSVEESPNSAIQRQIRSHAVELFKDVHGREATDRDEDEAELEQLEALYANCYFSPIASDGPLMTVPELEVPKTELILPIGYHYEQKQALDARAAAESAQRPEEPEQPDEPEETKAGANAPVIEAFTNACASVSVAARRATASCAWPGRNTTGC